MRIGIIGAGKIGGTLAELWARAGHEIMISSRHPDRLADRAGELGDRVRAGTLEEAARFGEVVLLAIPFGGLVTTLPDIAPRLAGKVVLDAMNPFPDRDGKVAEQARARGASGVMVQEHLPDSRVVRAFASVNYRDLQAESGLTGKRVAVPLAADDDGARDLAAALIIDAGFDHFDLGLLADSRPLDPEGVLFGRAMTHAEIREALDRT